MREAEFSDMFPFEMNESIRLTTPETLNDSPLTRATSLLLENRSQESIWIPAEPRALLFVYSEERSEWIPITNLVVHVGDQPLLLYPEGAPLSADILAVMPDLGDRASADVRVVVVGYIFRGGGPTDDRVGAYLDVGYPE